MKVVPINQSDISGESAIALCNPLEWQAKSFKIKNRDQLLSFDS